MLTDNAHISLGDFQDVLCVNHTFMYMYMYMHVHYVHSKVEHRLHSLTSLASPMLELVARSTADGQKREVCMQRKIVHSHIHVQCMSHINVQCM